MKLPLPWLLVGSVVALSLACQAKQESLVRDDAIVAQRTIEPRAWAHETSDIPVDPRIHFGHFENGLRWAWAQNAEPEKRCYLRLHVNVGSLGEEEHERGMAHFLEHMAFNGSTNFPAGTLIKWFQKHGMSFGADTNAHTAFSETVYKLDMPNADAETLRQGLLVLRDFADGLLLEETEVEAEKGVIDGEERERDSAGMRLMQQQLDIVFEGTRVGERLPIGTKKIRDAFTAESVRAFYERWYRPENMTLVAVGDLGELNPEGLFAEYFQNMPAPNAALVEEPKPGRATRFDHAYSIFEGEIPTASIAIERLRPWEEEPVTVEQWRSDLPLEYAHRMLNLRFTELAKEESAPFMGAGVGSAAALDVFDGESLAITCEPARWEEALAFCEQELRRALEFGFQQAELDEVRSNSLRSLDEAVERERTMHSGALLGRIVTAAESRYVPTDAVTTRDILGPAVAALDLASCNAALREAWSEGELSVSATGNLELGANGGEQLLAAVAASQRVPLEAGKQIEALEFAYASDETNPGKVLSREFIEDLGFWQLRFANGVMLNVKSTDFRENQILMLAHIGEGQLTLEPERNSIEWVGNQVFMGGGLEAHSDSDVRRLTAGKQVGVGFAVGIDSFKLSGSTTAADLLFQCELMCAYINAPGWRDEGLVQLRRQLPSSFEGLEHTPEGPIAFEFYPALFSWDRRFQTPQLEEALAVNMQDIREWLEPELQNDALELSIVGDVDVEEAIAIAARTFGKLGPRGERRALDERRVVPAPKSGLKQTHEIATDDARSFVLIAFPVPDGIDSSMRRRFTALKGVVSDRLLLEVRERLGAAYSPGAGVQMSTAYPGVGLLMMQAMADPEKVDTLVEACLGVASSLANEGVSDEEVERLREPILNGLRDQKRTNAYWLSVLARSQMEAQHLDDVRSEDAFFESYRAEDLSPLAADYLQPERASILIVNPKL